MNRLDTLRLDRIKDRLHKYYKEPQGFYSPSQAAKWIKDIEFLVKSMSHVTGAEKLLVETNKTQLKLSKRLEKKVEQHEKSVRANQKLRERIENYKRGNKIEVQCPNCNFRFDQRP